MVRFIFSFFVLVHGLIHFMGFAKAYSYGNITQLTKNISKPAGVYWLSAAILFILTGIFFLLRKEEWRVIGIISILVSQVLIITIWKGAKYGTIANTAILIFILFIANRTKS